ncbi:MAG: hypothetical protein R2705_24875 [Ilumatobacteraceae bacterium]
METTLVLIACVVMGLLVGSFLTVVVDRCPVAVRWWHRRACGG